MTWGYSVFLLQKLHHQPIKVRGLIRQSDNVRLEWTVMNFSHDSLLTVTLRVVCSFVLAWALIALTPGASALNAPQRSSSLAPVNSSPEYKASLRTVQRNYLAMVGPAPLRFAAGDGPLPPEPALPAPPPLKLPANTPESGPKSADTPSTPVNVATPSSIESTTLKPENSTPEPNAAKPVSILPDDTKTEIRAEDVLPFFRFPGGADNGPTVPFTTTQPRGSTAPPSSATYRQQ